jgi:putative membrane protein
VAPVAVPVLLGVLRYLTTWFRVAGGRVELRRGLLNRHTLSTPLDRVRTVDLTSSPIHRVLGLTTVRVGTGTASTDDDDRLDLDGLPVDRARRLREDLLRTSSSAADPADAAAVASELEPVLRLDLAWVRFAPLTSAGVVTAAGVLGVGTQVLNTLGGYDALDPASVADTAARVPVLLGIVVGVLAVALIVSVLAVTGYLMSNWGFTLAHGERAWHVRRGLFTTRETSIDDERLAGVTLGEPLGLRLAGGGRLSAIVTGLDRRQQGGSALAPAAPYDVVVGTARRVLRVPTPVAAPLAGHGARARRRRFTRALVPAVLLAVLLVALVAADGWPGGFLAGAVLVPAAALGLAVDRSRALGHAFVDGYVVSRSGSLNRRREVVDAAHVIGWNQRASWFQRRARLTTLVATTAGGRQSVSVVDVPEDAAERLSRAASPGLLEQFSA